MERNQISDTVNHGVIYVKAPGCFPRTQQKFLPYFFGIKKKLIQKMGCCALHGHSCCLLSTLNNLTFRLSLEAESFMHVWLR